MQIRKRNGKWSVQIRRRGFKNLYKTFEQKSDALKWSKQTEVSMDQSRFKDTTNASKTTLKSVLERHLTERISVVREPMKERARFNSVCKSKIVDKYLSELTPDLFAKYRDERKKEGAANATIVRELSFMSVAITKAIKIYNCWLPEHPVTNDIKPKEAAPRNRRLEEDELKRLLIFCKEKKIYWCPMIEFAIETTMRLNEQLTLTWKNINLKDMTIKVLAMHSKTGVDRVIPLTPRALELLKKMPRSLDERVFPLSYNNFNRTWRSICRKASIEGLRWHDLRREGCSRLLEKGLSISEVQMFTGHKTVSLMLNTYSSHNPKTVAKKLNA